MADGGSIPRHQRPSGLDRFLFGAPYYPEHWEPEDREHDAQRMQDAGMNVVRMAEFAWDVIEPARDRFDFDLFDETIARLGEHGIDTILCTPTATPPRWLTDGRDDWMRIRDDGARMEHGSRQHVCTNNEAFRAESRRITRAMAEHYADDPHVIGWQTDNEFYCHISLCYCEACQAGFRRFLADRYGDIAGLNRAWGCRFWAQTYDTFEQVRLPHHGRHPAPANPSAVLDHWRFLADGIATFQREQVEILRSVQPRWWVTHNGTFGNIDHWSFAEDLDFYGVDVYPGFAGVRPEDHTWAGMKNESCRSVSGGFIVPEQSGGPGGQLEFLHPTCEPGQMRLWAYQSIAAGADGILHFRWRTCRFGAEIYWNGILDHDNRLRRRYREFAQEGAELKRIGGELIGTVKDVRLGILYSDENEAAYQAQPNALPSPAWQAVAVFAEAGRRHLPVGLLHANDDFAGMRIIVMPTYLIDTPELAEKLAAFVANGGTLLVTARTFTRTPENQVLATTPPGRLAALLGVTREEEGRLPDDGLDAYTLVTADAREIPGCGGYEILAPQTATPVAAWRVGKPARHPHPAEGCCGFSVHRHGKGQAYYVGSYLNETSAPAVLDTLLDASPIAPHADADPNVETSLRHRDGRRYLFLLNHTRDAQTVRQLSPGTCLLAGDRVEGETTLEPFGVRIVKLD